MKKTLFALALPGLAFGAAMTLPATPGLSQAVEEEIIVSGRWRRNVPDEYQTASQPVSYADLDLSTDFGRSELKHRIRLTARYLCDKLGETDSPSMGSSCRDEATKDAMNRFGTWKEQLAPRGTAWVRPPAWQSPYSAEWASRYKDDNY